MGAQISLTLYWTSGKKTEKNDMDKINITDSSKYLKCLVFTCKVSFTGLQVSALCYTRSSQQSSSVRRKQTPQRTDVHETKFNLNLNL